MALASRSHCLLGCRRSQIRTISELRPDSLSLAAKCRSAGEGSVRGFQFSRAGAHRLLQREESPCGKGLRMAGHAKRRRRRRNCSGWLTSTMVSPGVLRGPGVSGAVDVVARNSEGRKESKESKSMMVDPVEAKRLAALEMAKIQADTLFDKNRRVEAINGGWAVLGLTAGIVAEGLTGRGIVVQFQSYWILVVQFLNRIFASPSS